MLSKTFPWPLQTRLLHVTKAFYDEGLKPVGATHCTRQTGHVLSIPSFFHSAKGQSGCPSAAGGSSEMGAGHGTGDREDHICRASGGSVVC
mmetsp:Transcript_34617/g.136511  ORF Transcript_34617/g.136511 Transcript_34617/m.136511 type:complete len:91 (-) Transcript_34617:694-966(-)